MGLEAGMGRFVLTAGAAVRTPAGRVDGKERVTLGAPLGDILG